MTTLSLTTTVARRFANAILGYQFSEQNRKDMTEQYFLTPENFSESEGFSHNFGAGKYLILTERDKLAYTKLWGEVNEGDFESLYYQTSVDKIYSNGELEIWVDRIE